mgnify:CR=1 FL=1
MSDSFDKILSVVVPTYNSESYLRTNLESFCIDEIREHIEVLIINDGSTDNSLSIAREYEEKYPNTYKVISKENGGHGSGINYGIKYSKGRYFKVVDSDDWVDRQGIINLVNVLKNTNTDIVYSNFLWAFDNKTKDVKSFRLRAEFEEPFKGVEYAKEYKFDKIADKTYIKMHNMTIKSNILKSNNIVIDENLYYVDSEYILYPIPYLDTVLFIKDVVYYYRIGRTGQSVGIDKMKIYEGHYDKVLKSLFDFYEMLGSNIMCSDVKKSYISRVIARVIAGKIKVALSFPLNLNKKEQIIEFDKLLKDKYKDIYDANVNSAINILRKTDYIAFELISLIYKVVKRV